MNRDEFDRDLKQMISDSKTLFGDVEEMNKDELQEMLNESGRTAEELRRLVWSAVDDVCKKMRLRGDFPPDRYTDLLNQLRPASQPSRHASVLVQQAQRWIRDLLSGVRKSEEL